MNEPCDIIAGGKFKNFQFFCTLSLMNCCNFVSLFFVGAQVCEVCDPLIYRVLACEFRVAINE